MDANGAGTFQVVLICPSQTQFFSETEPPTWVETDTSLPFEHVTSDRTVTPNSLVVASKSLSRDVVEVPKPSLEQKQKLVDILSGLPQLRPGLNAYFASLRTRLANDISNGENSDQLFVPVEGVQEVAEKIKVVTEAKNLLDQVVKSNKLAIDVQMIDHPKKIVQLILTFKG